MVFIMQFATGKTNHGVKLYGRVGTSRHVNALNCPIGPIAFHLFYHFEVTKEMDNPSIDFFDNSTWFDIKFITDISCRDQTKILENKTYSTAIDQTCKVLGISTKSWMHIGHKLGLFNPKSTKTILTTFTMLGIGIQRHRKSIIQQRFRWRPSIAKLVWWRQITWITTQGLSALFHIFSYKRFFLGSLHHSSNLNWTLSLICVLQMGTKLRKLSWQWWMSCKVWWFRMQLQCYLIVLIVLTMVYYKFQCFNHRLSLIIWMGWNVTLNNPRLLTMHKLTKCCQVCTFKNGQYMGSKNLSYVMPKVDKHETQMEDMPQKYPWDSSFLLEQCHEGYCNIFLVHWEVEDAEVSTCSGTYNSNNNNSNDNNVSTSGTGTAYCSTNLGRPWLLWVPSPIKTTIGNRCMVCMALIGALWE